MYYATRVYSRIQFLMIVLWPIAALFFIACGRSQGIQFNSAKEYQEPPKVVRTANAAAAVKKDFTTADIANSELAILPQFGAAEQKLNLISAPQTVETFRQVSRTKKKDQFQQGNGGKDQTQEFAALESGLFDLLIVIDNSSSMDKYQDKLQQDLHILLDKVAQTNWQIAAVTTDSNCLRETSPGSQKKTVTRKEYLDNPAQAQADYQSLIKAGIGGNTQERGIQMATEALVGDCGDPAKDWKRDGSTVVVLLVTDEDNCGSASNDGVNCLDKPWGDKNYFMQYAPNAANTKVFGLLFREYANALCPDSGLYEHVGAPIYEALVNETGGQFDEICRPDNYDGLLGKIAAHVNDQAVRSFELAHIPYPGTTQVYLDKTPLLSGFSLTNNVVSFDASVSTNHVQKVKIDYKTDVAPRTDSFKLTDNPDPRTINVSVNNNAASSNDYTFDASSNTVHFLNLPQDNANIEVEYRNNGALEDSFTISDKPAPDTIKVFVAGSEVSNFKVVDSQTIQLNAAPLDESLVDVHYYKPTDRQTRYPAVVDMAKVEGFSAKDADSHESLVVKLEGSELVFDQSQVFEGRAIVVVYNLIFDEAARHFEVPLPKLPLASDVEVSADGDAIICSNNINIEAYLLKFDCNSDNITAINVSFKYWIGYRNTFEVEGEFGSDAQWSVQVDGKDVVDFTMKSNNSIEISPEFCPVGANVTITVVPKEDRLVSNE